MNDIFSYKRFGKLLKNDIVRYLPKYYGNILIFLAVMPVIWAFKSFLSSSPMEPNTRFIIITVLTFVCTFLAPFKIYGNANHKKWGVDFTMLPASSLEKFLSMLLISTIFLPILLFTASLLIDTILTIIPTNGYYQYLNFTEIFTLDNITVFGKTILFMCFALCGNMLFRKNKLSKTVLSLFGISIILSIVISTSVYQVVRQIAYNKNGEVHTLINDKKITDSTSIDNYIVVAQENVVSVEDNRDKKITISKDGQKYTFNKYSIGPDIEQFINDNYKLLFILLNIIIYVIIPGLMYYITFTRIKKQQL